MTQAIKNRKKKMSGAPRAYNKDRTKLQNRDLLESEGQDYTRRD